MSARLISLIYFYIISALSLLLVIIGMYNAINFTVNITQYDTYPLQYEDSCDYFMEPMPAIDTKPAPQIESELSIASPSPDFVQKNKEQCLTRVENDRKKQKITDMKNAFFFTLVGSLLFGIHFPIALKRTNDKK